MQSICHLKKIIFDHTSVEVLTIFVKLCVLFQAFTRAGEIDNVTYYKIDTHRFRLLFCHFHVTWDNSPILYIRATEYSKWQARNDEETGTHEETYPPLFTSSLEINERKLVLNDFRNYGNLLYKHNISLSYQIQAKL